MHNKTQKQMEIHYELLWRTLTLTVTLKYVRIDSFPTWKQKDFLCF